MIFYVLAMRLTNFLSNIFTRMCAFSIASYERVIEIESSLNKKFKRLRVSTDICVKMHVNGSEEVRLIAIPGNFVKRAHSFYR